MEAPPVSQDEIVQLFEWVDTIPLTRPVRNFNRDFSDGVLVAEIFKQYYPNLVQLHNYQAASSSTGKFVNWKTLNEKVFRKLGFQTHRADLQNIIVVSPGAMERVLAFLYKKIKQSREQHAREQNSQQEGALLKLYPVETSVVKDLSSRLAEKEEIIGELRDTVQILESKMKKMEQLLKLKDSKIETLMRKLEQGL